MYYCYEGKNEKKQNLSLRISRDVTLWLARMCVGEGGMNVSVKKMSIMLWAMVHRYLLHPAVPKWEKMATKHGAIPENGDPFIGMIRMFSQPINPRWSIGGDKAKKYEGTKFATSKRLARRERIQSMLWRDIPKRIRTCVEEFANGDLRFMIPTTLEKRRLSNWASLKSTSEKYPWGIDIDGDWFFEDKGLVNGCVIIKSDGAKEFSWEEWKNRKTLSEFKDNQKSAQEIVEEFIDED